MAFVAFGGLIALASLPTLVAETDNRAFNVRQLVDMDHCLFSRLLLSVAQCQQALENSERASILEGGSPTVTVCRRIQDVAPATSAVSYVSLWCASLSSM